MRTNKENKIAYKQMKFRAGIFEIKNITNQKIFLKKSKDLDRAFNSDRFQLNLGSHKNKQLQKDWNSLGADSFEFNIFDELTLKDSTTDIEIQNELNELLEMHKTELKDKGIALY